MSGLRYIDDERRIYFISFQPPSIIPMRISYASPTLIERFRLYRRDARYLMQYARTARGAEQ